MSLPEDTVVKLRCRHWASRNLLSAKCSNSLQPNFNRAGRHTAITGNKAEVFYWEIHAQEESSQILSERESR